MRQRPREVGVAEMRCSGPSQAASERGRARARQLAGLKGYVTNLPLATMDGASVIAAYHDLWHVEQSFRMTKSDLRARPVFHHQRDAIEPHLTVVFAALAVARHLQDTTGTSVKKTVQTLYTARSATIEVNGERLTLDPNLTETTRTILNRLETGHQGKWRESGPMTRSAMDATITAVDRTHQESSCPLRSKKLMGPLG